MTTPDPAPVLDSLDGFRRSKSMFAALQLGVFERLESASARADVVARELKLHPDATERLLDSCVGMGLLAKQDGAYSNLPVVSAYLVRSSPQALVGDIDYSHKNARGNFASTSPFSKSRPRLQRERALNAS